MMIYTSIYSVVDGFFVSNFAGKTPFAAINLIMPFLMILSTLGIAFMRPIAAVLLLPMIWEIDGVWISIVVAEFMAVVFSGIFLIAKRKKYHY